MSAQLLLAPAIGIPVAGLLWYNSRQKDPEDRVSNGFLLKTWLASGFVGPAAAGGAQAALAWPCAKFVFGDQLDRYLKELGRGENEVRALDPDTIAFRRDLAFSMPNLAASIFLSTLAPATEEVFKYYALCLVERYFPQKTKNKRNYVVIAMAIGLGFALAENLAFIATASSKETQAQHALTIIERAIFGSSGHLLTAALTGSKFAKAEGEKRASRGLWSTIKESLLYHGLGNFSLFAITTLYGNVGFVHPRDPLGIFAMLGCVLTVNGLAAWRVSQELAEIDRQPAQKAS